MNYCRVRHLTTLAVALVVGVAAQEISLQDISRNDSSTRISWEGGVGPYQVQQTSDFLSWNDIGDPVDALETTVEHDGDLAFFRIVQAAAVPPVGEFVGQLRVDEGEFGRPMAKHRLKSIWNFHLPEGGIDDRTALGYFSQLVVDLEILEGDATTRIMGPLESFPEASLRSTSREIGVSWMTSREGVDRAYELTLSFRYDVRASRATINLSDPTYTLTCRYLEPQLEISQLGELTSTRTDETDLYEIEPSENPPAWLSRQMSFSKGGIGVNSRYWLGIPNIEGFPAFIFKTPVLERWGTSRISGLTSEPILLTSRFSQTYSPFHHNFVETIYFEPSLEPGIDPAALEELREANVRIIIATNPSAFPGQSPSLRILGFDGRVREIE